MAAYVVTTYDCDTQLDAIKDLAAIADNQQKAVPPPFDPRVLPWTHGCAKSHKSVFHIRHYVAQKPDGTIVGWCLAETRRRFGRIYVYLSEITVTQVQSPDHKGIGRALHAALYSDAVADGAFFIYLYPLTDKAAASYTSWGYTAPYPGVKQQFLELRPATDKKRVVPERLTSKLRDPVPATLFVEAHALAMSLGDKELATRVDKVSRTRKTDVAFVARLRDALETIAVFTDAGDDGEETMDASEQLASLHEIFDSAGGRRRTRRRRHRRGRKSRRRV